MRLPLKWAPLVALAACLLPVQAWSEEKSQVLAPGYGPLQFQAPAAGSYQLPPLGAAADGKVLDSNAIARRLHQLSGDKLVLMGFIYTHCPDVNGCPLASFVMKKVQRRLLDRTGRVVLAAEGNRGCPRKSTGQPNRRPHRRPVRR